MATFSFPTLNDLPPAPSNSSDPTLTPRDDLSICIPRFKTAEELLEVFNRVAPQEYIDPLFDPGPGGEILQMFAKIMERASVAVGRAECGLNYSLAHGGFKARGIVEFYRDNAIAGTFTLLRGSVVRTSKTRREFVLLRNLVFGASDLVLQAEVEARQADYQFNVEGRTFTADGTPLEGEIDELTLPLMEPPLAELTLQVRQPVATSQGQPDTLGELGKDRSIFKQVGETDDDYRRRIQSLPETISPEALVKQLDQIFIPIDKEYTLIETWLNTYQAGWDGPDSAITNLVMEDFDPNLFVYDDPRANPPFRNRWLGAEDHRAGLVLVIPNLETFRDFGCVDDDPALSVSDLTSPLGERALSADDIPSDTLLDPDVISTPCAVDGEDELKASFIRNMNNLMQKVKAGGVFFTIELEGQ